MNSKQNMSILPKFLNSVLQHKNSSTLLNNYNKSLQLRNVHKPYNTVNHPTSSSGKNTVEENFTSAKQKNRLFLKENNQVRFFNDRTSNYNKTYKYDHSYNSSDASGLTGGNNNEDPSRLFPEGDFSQHQNNDASSTSLLNFDDTELLYRSRSTFDLLQSIVFLKSCRIPLVNKYGPTILEYGGPLAEFASKYTYFRYFCGGEYLDDSFMKQVAHNAAMRDGFQCIFDYSVEGVIPVPSSVINQNLESSSFPNELVFDTKRTDSIADVIKQSIIFSHHQNQIHQMETSTLPQTGNNVVAPQRASFSVVKLTGICDVKVLQRVSEILTYCQVTSNGDVSVYNALQKELLPSSFVIEDYIQQRTPGFAFYQKPSPLSPNECEKLEYTMKQLDSMVQLNSTYKISMLIDAEQSFLQAAIDHMYMHMCLKYNTNNLSENETPTVYNTYQLYLKDGFNRLKYDHEFAMRYNRSFACKLVRGAYMRTESKRSMELDVPYPVNETIEKTHEMYNKGVQYSMEQIIKTGGDFGLVIASHNQQTIKDSTEQIVYKYNLPRRIPKIQFAQLHGMGDSMSLALSHAGFNISKYIPFGPLKEVMPYLSRRISENGDILSGTSIDIGRMEKEVSRRLFSKKQ